MSEYNIIAAANEATVVAEYTPEPSKNHEYQSEAQLEKQFIKDLQSLGYTYLDIHQEKDLLDNLRTQLEKLNHISFSQKEWEQLYHTKICNNNM